MIFEYITYLLIVCAFILGISLAYTEGKLDGQKECLLIIRIKFPKIYKMLVEEISKNSSILKRD